MRINNNISALNAHRQLTTNAFNQAKSLERLSSGFRINRAGDDAAGLAISEKMRAQIRGLNQASRNSQDGISLIQTAEGAMNEMHSILQRMRELAIQSANGTNVEVDRAEIQKEINQLSSEINRIGNTTEFNTMKLLEGSRYNSLTSFTGNFGSASGAATASVTGAIGVAAVSFTGSSLTAGSHNLNIARTTEVHADQQVQNADIKYSGGNVGVNRVSFSGNSVTTSAGGGGFVSGNVIAMDLIVSGDDVYLHVQASGDSGSISDLVRIGASAADSITYHYQSMETDADGNAIIEFSVTVAQGTSGQIWFDSGDVTAGATLGTQLLGYAGANTGGNQWLISGSAANLIGIGTPGVGGGALPETQMDWTIRLSGADGANGFVLSGVGADGTVIIDSVSTDVSSAAFTYVGYGLTFTVSGASGDDGDMVQFTTTPTYTWAANVDGGASVNIVSGASGGATITATDLQVGGVQFSSAGLSAGTGTFTVVTEGTSGTDNSVIFQIGANQNQSLALSISDVRSQAIKVTTDSSGGNNGVWIELSREYDGLTTASGGKHYIQAFFTETTTVTDGTSTSNSEYALDMSTSERASAAVTVLNDAIERVSAERSMLGANQNRLEHTINNLGTAAENLQAAESRIRDLDMAQEMMAFTRNNILNQAATAMLAQANMLPQTVLQLLG